MKPKILVCAHTDVQLRVLVQHSPFFSLARSHEVLKRIYEIGDLAGLAASRYLFLLPDAELGTRRLDEALAFWKSYQNLVVAITEDQVLGKVAFVPPADCPHSNLYRPSHYTDDAHAISKQFRDFPKYFGRSPRNGQGIHA